LPNKRVLRTLDGFHKISPLGEVEDGRGYQEEWFGSLENPLVIDPELEAEKNIIAGLVEDLFTIFEPEQS